jgi:hypothetical protein
MDGNGEERGILGTDVPKKESTPKILNCENREEALFVGPWRVSARATARDGVKSTHALQGALQSLGTAREDGAVCFALAQPQGARKKSKQVSGNRAKKALTVLHGDVVSADVDGARVAEHAQRVHVAACRHLERSRAATGYCSVSFTPSHSARVIVEIVGWGCPFRDGQETFFLCAGVSIQDIRKALL